MIPLRDNIPHIRPPYITYTIIALNIMAFFWELALGSRLPEFIEAFGFVPQRFLALWGYLPETLPLAVIPLFTSLFLHGGWFHIIANMWFLFIFGNNVEDTLGSWRYLMFYLLCGVGANFIFLAFAPRDTIPLIGASGAIAGVMGAYFFLFPGARILALVPIFIVFTVMELPAYIFLGLWFLLQFFFGTYTSLQSETPGGVAWWAHVGGFVVGIILLHLFAPRTVRLPFRPPNR